MTDTAPQDKGLAAADLGDAAGAAPHDAERDALFARLEALTAEEGHFEALGTRHWAFFEDAGTTLIVTFDQLGAILARETTMPWGHAIAAERGWSHLCLIADGPTLYRDAAVYRHFDRLVDDAFFEDFDRVLFYGHGIGGHAACAYSVTAPGAMVLALNPVATLAPAEALWDRRNLAARRLDFTSRYGYAPDMLEGADKVVVIHDLTLREEAMHSALFRAPWVTRLSAPLMGDRIEWALRQMGVLPQMIDLAMAGKLDAVAFAKLWRKRRAFSPYLRALLDRNETTRQKHRAITICAAITRRLKAPYFARKLAKLTGQKEPAPK